MRIDSASAIRDGQFMVYPVILLMVSPHIKLCGTVVLTDISGEQCSGTIENSTKLSEDAGEDRVDGFDMSKPSNVTH